jgi:hypothetical protein
MIQNHVNSDNYSINVNMDFFPNKSKLILIIPMWLIQDFNIGYKCLINPFSHWNVDMIDPYFYMSFLNVNYITLCKLHEKQLILSEVKNWKMWYLVVVTLVVAHYIADLPSDVWHVFNY